MELLFKFFSDFISTRSFFIPSLPSIDFSFKINGSCNQSCEIDTSTGWKLPFRDCSNACKFFYFNDSGQQNFSSGNFKLWKIIIVAWSNATHTDWNFIIEGRYPFPSCDHVDVCSVNGGVQVVKVAEYGCRLY